MTQSANTAVDAARTKAHVGPFVIFMAFLAVPDVLGLCGIEIPAANSPDVSWWSVSQVWLYSLQTVACAIGLWWWWKHYEFRPASGVLLGIAFGVVGIALWILPGYLFRHWEMNEGWWQYLGFTARNEGYNPGQLRNHGDAIYFGFLAMRFCRLVLVVPLIEEIFWRSFLMRILVDPEGDFWKVPFGTFHLRSLAVVTGLFVMAHSSADYSGALIYGLLTYWLAVKSKSLTACVAMHATANLLLGVYVLQTGQWGYW